MQSLPSYTEGNVSNSDPTCNYILTATGQLQKMGILPSAAPAKTPTPAKRKSTQIDFGNLAPLNANAAGTKNFAGYRDTAGPSKPKIGKVTAPDAMDSDADDDDEPEKRDEDDGQDPIKLLSPEEALQEEKLSEDVRKIKVGTNLLTELTTILTSH
jgi:hypothetical protein